MLDKIIDIIMTVLPFFGGRKKRQQMMQEVKEFSELVKEQYNFLKLLHEEIVLLFQRIQRISERAVQFPHAAA